MRSLRSQLTIGLLLAFALLLGAGGILVYWAVRESLYNQFDSALRLKALVVVTDTHLSAGQVRVHFSDRFLREFDKTVATDFFQVFDQQGSTVAKSDSLGEKRLPGKLRGPLDAPVYWNMTLPTGDLGRAIGVTFRPTVRSGEESQDITVVVAASRRLLHETLAELQTVLVACGATLLALTGLVVPLVLGRKLKPLTAVAERAAHIDAGTLSQRFAVETMPSELKPVGETLNALLARLEQSFERERQFSSDLAHELRTPLAELRTQAELALKWPEERNPEADRVVLDIALQLEMLVSRLLALSRTENAQGTLQKAPVLVRPMVEEILRRLDQRITDRCLRVQHQGLDVARATTDGVLLESILTNLLENAVSYAPSGSPITVACSSNDEHFVFSVENQAPDLEPDDLAKLFDRFWRKDSSRSGVAHAGLGLALSRSFAQALGLTLEARLTPTGTLKLTLQGAP